MGYRAQMHPGLGFCSRRRRQSRAVNMGGNRSSEEEQAHKLVAAAPKVPEN